MSWSNENKSCMRVDKREFTWEFYQLVFWSNENKSRLHVLWQTRVYIRVSSTRVLVKREQEFTRERFHQLSCPGQIENKNCMRVSSTLVFVWPGHDSLINSHGLVKREQEFHESWQARVCMRVSPTFVSWSNERTRVAWELTRVNFNLNLFYYIRLRAARNNATAGVREVIKIFRANS